MHTRTPWKVPETFIPDAIKHMRLSWFQGIYLFWNATGSKIDRNVADRVRSRTKATEFNFSIVFIDASQQPPYVVYGHSHTNHAL
jgi:hypothetical protein